MPDLKNDDVDLDLPWPDIPSGAMAGEMSPPRPQLTALDQRRPSAVFSVRPNNTTVKIEINHLQAISSTVGDFWQGFDEIPRRL